MQDEPITATPAPEGTPWQRLDRVVVPLWILGDLASAVFLLALCAAGYFYVQQRQAAWSAHAGIAWMALAAVMLLWSVLVPPLAYMRWAFVADDDLLRMRYGILFHEERIVPVHRMQHVDLTRGPVERLFGLATLVVFTAGNEGSAFRVPGLTLLRAQQLRDRILKARGDGAL
jgi:membrane protein YdbS with pleckstrin-like domain